MPPNEGRVQYRRNGKKPACEPCRKGKMACDHGDPFCGRCVRRQTTAKCIYHPAPMTKKTSPQGMSPSMVAGRTSDARLFSPTTLTAPRRSRVSAPRGENSNLSTDEVRTTCSDETSEGTSDSSSDSDHDTPPSDLLEVPRTIRKIQIPLKYDWKHALFRTSTRYYGPTSFSAIFSEHQADLLDIGENTRKHPGAWQFGEPLLGRERPNGPTARARETIRALWNMPTEQICETLLAALSSTRDMTLDQTMIRHCIKTLYSTFGTELALPHSVESLTKMSMVLFENEERPLPPSPEDGTDWLDTFMGPRIRFEMLGMLFCFFGLAYLSLQDWDPLFKIPENGGRDRKETAWRMKECADVCLRMCDYSETVNYLVAALILDLKRLETGCTGDETYHMRRIHGDLVTVSITSGLHRLPDPGTCELTTALEYKRRLFMAIYCSDKTHASLNGVPPLLTRNFCNIQLCLDLPAEAIFLPSDELTSALSRIDRNGWDITDDACHISTFLRAKTLICMIREEVLELALSVTGDGSKERIEHLRQRSQQTFAALPYQLHYYSREKVPKDSTGLVLYDQAYLLLQHLQNTVLIERVAIARGFATAQFLLDTALEMMETALMFWRKRDQLMCFAFGFDWIITYYGIPSAGVICVELLKGSTGHSSAEFSRSDAIQKLTLFIAFLEWVRPTDGNYTLAQRLRKVVRSVLDHVLEPSKNEPTSSQRLEVPFDPLISSFVDANDMDWLNTIDWTQGSWMTDFS